MKLLDFILENAHLSGYDWIANKPHASPADHSYNYLMDLLLHPDLSRLSLDEGNVAMTIGVKVLHNLLHTREIVDESLDR